MSSRNIGDVYNMVQSISLIPPDQMCSGEYTAEVSMLEPGYQKAVSQKSQSR